MLVRALMELEQEEHRSLELAAVQFIGRNEQAIERMIRRIVRRFKSAEKPQLIEAARDGAYQSVAGSMRTYDRNHASGASMRTHVLGNARWYAWKAIEKELARMQDRVVDDQRRHKASEDRSTAISDAGESVQCLLGKLPEDYAELLRWRYIDELSLDEIAEMLDCSHSKAYRSLEAAMAAARQLAQELAREPRS